MSIRSQEQGTSKEENGRLKRTEERKSGVAPRVHGCDVDPPSLTV
jgi:hypothetical protein